MTKLINLIITKRQVNIDIDQSVNPEGNDLNFDLSLNLPAFSCCVLAVTDRISPHSVKMNDILPFTAAELPVEQEYIYLEKVFLEKQ